MVREMKSWKLMVMLLIAGLHFSELNGQSRWDGEGGDGDWNNPLNWNNNSLPTTFSNVILNNEFVATDYAVRLPAGNISVSIQSLIIHPGSGSISVIIPPANTAVPALTVTGPGYGLIIQSGGIFKNSSGAGSGNTIAISDSIRINNGGRYIHNSARTHTSVVQILSAAPGTEEGVFEFDIPLASTTVGLSDRIFGKLVFAAPAGPTINYTASGINSLHIRSDLELKNGVRLSLNLEDTVFVARHLMLGNGILNISSGVRNTVINVSGNIQQEPGGVITQTGTGSAELRLNGSQVQLLDMKGLIQNAVTLKVESTGGVQLQHQLTVPYKLQLIKGVVQASATKQLILDAPSLLEVDENSNNSFIDGPVKKLGLASTEKFLFPVGKGGLMRWLEVRNATGNFMIEYHRSDPRIHASAVLAPLHHISTIEYWTLTMDQGIPGQASIKLSFLDPNSGGVTDLAALRVARLQSGSWQSMGNNGTTGTAGSSGSVLSEPISFGEGAVHFVTLSSVSVQNPLPLQYLNLKVKMDEGSVRFQWDVNADNEFLYFLLQGSSDGRRFQNLSRLNTVEKQTAYGLDYNRVSLLASITPPAKYFRVLGVNKDSSVFSSKIIYADTDETSKISIAQGSGTGATSLIVDVLTKSTAELQIFDMTGRLLERKRLVLETGRNYYPLNEDRRLHGVCILNVLSNNKRTVLRVLF